MTTMRHGTRSMYVNGPCRGVECTAANTAYYNILKARLVKRTPPIHGLSGYTNYDCRCPTCYKAKQVANAHHHKRRKATAP